MTVKAMSFAAIVMSIAMISIGCGDDGGEASTAPASVTKASVSKAEFIEKANAVCRKERADLMEEVSDFERRRAGRKPTPYSDVVHLVFLPTVEEELRKVEELDWPTGEEERVNRVLFTQQGSLDSLAVKPRVASLQVAKQRFAWAGKQLRAYGLASCAWGPRSS